MPHPISTPAAILGAALAFATLTGCQSAPERQTARTEVHLEQAIPILAARQDADSLAAAGLLNATHHSERSMAQLARATELAPERADLLWLEVQVCTTFAEKGETCDPAPVEARLRARAPTNGIGWFGDLSRAVKAGDMSAREAALDNLSRSEHIDIYWNPLVASLTRAATVTGKVSIAEAELAIIGMLAAEALPALQPVGAGCRGDALKEPAVLARCKGIARAFQHGDSVLMETFGTSLAARVWPKDSAEWNMATQRHEVLNYRVRQWSQLEAHNGWPESTASRFLQLCSQYRSEQPAQEAMLLAVGKNPNPGAN